MKCLQRIIYVPPIIRIEFVHLGEQSYVAPDKARTQRSKDLSCLARSAKEVSELSYAETRHFSSNKQRLGFRPASALDVPFFDPRAISCVKDLRTLNSIIIVLGETCDAQYRMTSTSEFICHYMDLEIFRRLISRDPSLVFPEEYEAFEIMISSLTYLQNHCVLTFNDLL